MSELGIVRERVNLFQLADAERWAVLAAFLRASNLHVVRWTQAGREPFFGVLSEVEVRLATEPIPWAAGHADLTVVREDGA